MYRTIVIVRIKNSPFFGANIDDLIAVAVQPTPKHENCIVCATKLRPENTPMGLGGMTWQEFFKWFEIMAFTDYYKKGTWPQSWCENEGTIYWR